MSWRSSTPLWTGTAMLAFAANSLLCRWALLRTPIDAATFTAVRLLTGALALGALVGFRRERLGSAGTSWASALALFVYAAAFSFAYVRLQTGVGALLLFGAVQLSMLGWGIAHGERLKPRGWAGAALAIAGLFALTLPGARPPDPVAAALMVTAGVSWGAYSLRGRGTGDPLEVTAGNFVRTLPMAAISWGAAGLVSDASAPVSGMALAALSGAVASGMGYAIWYRALRGLTASEASIVQLSVPVLAASLGILLLSEPLSPRLLGAGITILLGIALFNTAPRTRPRNGRERGSTAELQGE